MYYQAGGQRIALRINGVVRWLATDHLGSTALTASETGGRLSEIRYKPWGESRYTFGATPTQRRFTGQVLDEVAGGLYFYNARYYDPALGRFTQADTIIPQPENPQNLNRYSYVGNQPLKYSDPSGRDWVDAVNFVMGFASQWASANTWMAPQAQETLSVQPNEPAPMTVGRHLGNVAAAAQGLGEMTGGASLVGGGAVACGTGVLCLAGAPAIVAGAAIAAHGATVAVAGAVMEGEMLGNAVAMAKLNRDGNRGADPDQRQNGQNASNASKESKPYVPLAKDRRATQLGPQAPTLLPGDEAANNLDPKRIGWGRFLLIKTAELIDAIMGSAP